MRVGDRGSWVEALEAISGLVWGHVVLELWTEFALHTKPFHSPSSLLPSLSSLMSGVTITEPLGPMHGGTCSFPVLDQKLRHREVLRETPDSSADAAYHEVSPGSCLLGLITVTFYAGSTDKTHMPVLSGRAQQLIALKG